MSDQHLDLLGLLRGELTNAEITAAADHFDSCPECRDELAETAVGHALLSGATRTLARGAREEAPPAAVLPEPPALSLPAEPRRWTRPLGLVAAAAALVVGTATVTSYVTRPGEEPQPPVAGDRQSADLEPVQGTGGGQVVMASTDSKVTMSVETDDLPPLKEGQFYYVWLFNPKTEKMLPLGVVGPEGKAGFTIPPSLVGRYQVVDISLEKDDGDPGHSVTSVLRASYAEDDGTQES